MPKVDKYRGKVKEELEGLTIEEFMPLLTSRARRALRRATTKASQLRKLIKKASKLKSTNPGKVIRTHMREAVIIPAWLGMAFAVHNGKEWKSVVITVDKLGYRLGDFSHTTGRVLHSGPGVGATRGSKFIPLK